MLFNKGEMNIWTSVSDGKKRCLWHCSVAQFIPIVSRLREVSADLVTIYASVVKDKGVVLDYYFYLEGRTCIVRTAAEKLSVGSIYTFFPNADFVEREINNLFQVNFLGHPNLPRYGSID